MKQKCETKQKKNVLRMITFILNWFDGGTNQTKSLQTSNKSYNIFKSYEFIILLYKDKFVKLLNRLGLESIPKNHLSRSFGRYVLSMNDLLATTKTTIVFLFHYYLYCILILI